MEITDKEMIFTTDNSQKNYSFLINQHQSEIGGRNVIYNSSDGTNNITTRILGKTCSDTISGQRFETGVEITFNDTTYRGCGQGLH